jgi:hypothetical protein
VHINVSATTKKLALESARQQLDQELEDKKLAAIILSYVTQRVEALDEPQGQVVEITADLSVEVAAYLRIA